MTEHTAFISYSYAADEERAPKLQAALYQIARPWFRQRARNVLLDRGNLRRRRRSAEELEIALQQLVARADTFVLLASRAAASSNWVSYEVEQWLKRCGLTRFLIVLTDGQIRWDQNKGDFDWQQTTALPRCLKRRFPGEPLYIDLSREQAGQRLQDDPRVLSAVITLAGALDARAKDELIDASIRESRRSQTIALLSSLVISLAGVVAVILWFVGPDRAHNLLAANVILCSAISVTGYFVVRRLRIRTNLYKSLKAATHRTNETLWEE